MIHDYTVLIPIAALLLITAGMVHGIWYAYQQHKARQNRDPSAE
jgi:hypothetical protein